eukprot:TRINITY_DN9606_c0_g1_i2.p1 TRINITY_DN9606_c0_g1~~TRINITY_DN9606_c0_g1_i2.p1  ORF type:complete len:608 (-),score=135.52 TRINITY_DN9606_c0_g1_i2:1-1824(-)
MSILNSTNTVYDEDESDSSLLLNDPGERSDHRRRDDVQMFTITGESNIGVEQSSTTMTMIDDGDDEDEDDNNVDRHRHHQDQSHERQDTQMVLNSALPDNREDHRIHSTLCYRWSRFKSFWNKRACNLLIVIILTALAEASRGVVLPTINSYNLAIGGNSALLGVIIASFSVGRLISSLVFGYWSDRSIKLVLLCSTWVVIVGNIAYMTAYPAHSLTILIISRFITGFGTGTLSVGRGYIAKVTTPAERTRFLSYSGAAQFLGFSITPGLSGWFDRYSSTQSSWWNEFTLPGTSMAVLNLILFVFILLFFDSHVTAPPVEEPSATTAAAAITSTEKPSSPSLTSSSSSLSSSLSTAATSITDTTALILRWGVGLFLALNFLLRGGLGIAETLMPPVQLSLNQDDSDALQDSAEYFLVLGSVGFLVYLAVPYICKFVDEVRLLSVAIAIAGLGFFVSADFDDDLNIYEFTSGAFLVWSIASPISQTLVISSFSKILGSKPQGGAMGWITSAGSLGRILFPLLAGSLPPQFAFIIGTFVCLVCITLIYMFDKWKVRIQKAPVYLIHPSTLPSSSSSSSSSYPSSPLSSSAPSSSSLPGTGEEEMAVIRS